MYSCLVCKPTRRRGGTARERSSAPLCSQSCRASAVRLRPRLNLNSRTCLYRRAFATKLTWFCTSSSWMWVRENCSLGYWKHIPSQSEVGGGGRSPTRPITPVPTGVGDGANGGVWLLGRGGATEANFFGWL